MIAALAIGAILARWTWQAATGQTTIDIERVSPQPVQFLVDVNKADWTELTVLPDFGESLAKRVVESRELEGPYVDVKDLLRVKGIGRRTLEKIRPFIAPIPDLENTAGESRASESPISDG